MDSHCLICPLSPQRLIAKQGTSAKQGLQHQIDSHNESVRDDSCDRGRSRENVPTSYTAYVLRPTAISMWLMANKRKPLVLLLLPQEVSKKGDS